MGGAVSTGADNDELIDNLLEANYIKSAVVERVFRAVDRGHYFTVEHKERAYRDSAWKCGNLHISAPCIYSRVMENLKLAPGMSFLNLGSGTGYLSTMAGLILGSYGINHGIEIHEDVLNYSTKKLEEFISTSSAIDEYEFCEPKFVCGNCLFLGSGARLYDRVYCGAACPENHENYMKNLIKVGGILVMPVNDQLLQICRTSDSNWESKSVLPVSFATLICSKIPDCSEPLQMPDIDPLSLQDICRSLVRSILRRNIDIEHPELKKPPKVPRKKVKKRTLRRFLIPIFDSNSEGEEDQGNRRSSTAEDRQEFLMDLTCVRTCRSIIDWQLMQESAEPTDANEGDCTSETSPQRSSTAANETKEDEDVMEDDSSIDLPPDNSNENIFEEMSDEEFLSDFEELHNMLVRAETSTVTSGSNSEKERKKQSSETENSSKQKNKSKSKCKREKVDSGIVEDIETEKEVSSESDNDDEDEDEKADAVGQKCSNPSGDQYPFLKITDSDTDTENCENIRSERKTSIDTPPHNVDSPPVNVINYSSYMKEKIKMLPLPMTLKYFLNLNREL